MNEEITYRIASNKDYPNILVLYNKMYQSNRSLEDFKWLVEDNPAGKATLFIALLEDRVVGMQSLIPYAFVRNGKSLLTYKSEDSLVESDLRGRGIYSQLYKMVHEYADAEDKMVWGLTDKKKILVHVNMPSTHRLAIAISVNKPSLASDKKGLHRLVAKTVFYSLLYLKSSFRTKKVTSQLLHKEIKPSEYSSQELESFFASLSSQNPEIYFPVMDPAYLKWRLNTNPNLPAYKIVVSTRSDGTIVACSLLGMGAKAAYWQSFYALNDVSLDDKIGHISYWKKKVFASKINLIHSWFFDCNPKVNEVQEVFYQSGFSKVRDGLWIVHNSTHKKINVHDLYFSPQLGIR